MTDDIVKRLRSDWFGYDVSLRAIDAMEEAADRIEQLTAERDGYRKVLEDIIADCEADYPPSHGAIKYAARAALKGETP